MNKPEITIEDADLDEHTIKYLECVSALKGQQALDAWLKYTGWVSSATDSNKGYQRSLESRLRKAKTQAKATKWTPD